MILYSCFLFQTLYQDLFCLPKPTPLTVRAKIVISPSINDEFYLGAVRVIILFSLQILLLKLLLLLLLLLFQ